ncbi:homeobox protein vex1-like [Centrocercus urophasianus]|nr:homeobox protein vex1-like [Centrocercus urophasianus]
MTKAPFSVEWLSQSSQAPKSPTQGTPHRSSPSAAVRRLASSSRPGLSERSKEKGAGKGREPSATPPAAGAVGQPQEERGRECSCPEEPRGGRRLRTAFSAEQISTLESSFQRHRYLGAAERRKLAGRMRLSEVQIKTWFQNRRMKLKRQLQELRPEPFCTPALPFRPQVSLPVTYMARPPPLPGHEAAPGGFALAALPAPALDISSACRAQPAFGGELIPAADWNSGGEVFKFPFQLSVTLPGQSRTAAEVSPIPGQRGVACVGTGFLLRFALARTEAISALCPSVEQRAEWEFRDKSLLMQSARLVPQC